MIWEKLKPSSIDIDWGTSWAPELSYGQTSDLADSIMSPLGGQVVQLSFELEGSHLNSLWLDEEPSDPIPYRVNHEYWIHCSSVVAEYLGVVNGDHTWRSLQTYTTPHKYSSVWDIVKDWVSDDGEVTAEDYYRRVTGHVLFSPCYYSPSTLVKADSFYLQTKAGDQLCVYRDFIHSEEYMFNNFYCRIEWSKYPQFIPKMEWNRELEKWACSLIHITDLNGPCATCRQLMEKVPITIITENQEGSILL